MLNGNILSGLLFLTVRDSWKSIRERKSSATDAKPLALPLAKVLNDLKAKQCSTFGIARCTHEVFYINGSVFSTVNSNLLLVILFGVKMFRALHITHSSSITNPLERAGTSPNKAQQL